MSYAADMGARPSYTPSEAQQRERQMIDTIARQLDLRPIPESRTAALSLGVAWGTENAYALAEILAELADRCGSAGPAEEYAQRNREQYMESRTLDGVKTGLVLGDEVDRDFRDPHADADPADHTIPYGWIRTVADAHYSLREGQEMPPELAQMQTPPRDFPRHTMILAHAIDLARVIEKFLQRAQPCPGIFTERLQAVNSYLQQIENEEAGDA